MMSFKLLPLEWTPINLNNKIVESKVADRLADVLHSWEDTPYNSKQHAKGVGTFCTAFVCGVLDELYRKPVATPLADVPHDASMHNPEMARSGLRWFMRHYPTAERFWSVTVDGDEDGGMDGHKLPVQPGDVLITGPVGGGPGHAIMIGPRKNVMWQASLSCVHYTGFAIPMGMMLYAVYRFTDREGWV